MNALALPLLAKELTEIAARRRTYITRVVYALLLFGFFVGINESTLRHVAANPLNAMGTGKEMFEVLIVLQLIGICLFLPAFTAGLITQEKERDSLVLLLLTELSPWQILLQKLGFGLVSIFSFLLIGMPLGALCYAYGGISPETLFQGIVVLFLTCLQVATFALLCSTLARTTVGAFIGTYVGAGLFIGAVALIGEGMDYYLKSNWDNRVLLVFPPAVLDRWGPPGIGKSALLGLPSFVTSFVFLLLARFYFVRRAFAPARNRLLGCFRWLDTRVERFNARFGNVTFRSRERALPGDDPIAWREMTRTALGRPHYLARLLIPVEILTCAICLWAVVEEGSSRENEILSLLAAALGTIAVLALSAFSANAFVSERISQTLEVLLTTPLVARDIVRQKARMLTRFMWVLAVPLATIFGLEAWAETDGTAWPPLYYTVPKAHHPTMYLIWALLSLAVYLPLVLWLSLWIGLKMRTRFRAILTALGAIVGWCIVPVVICAISNAHPGKTGAVFLALSPLTVPAMNEFHDLDEIFRRAQTLGPALNFLFYGILALIFRALCLRRADRYLRN